MNDIDYMEIALAEAQKSAEAGEIPVGAVIVYKGDIIAVGHNKTIGWCDATAHAEIVAIRDAGRVLHDWHLNGATLYVTMEPCPMCCGAILNSNIKRVVFGCHDNELGAVESRFNLLTYPCLKRDIEVVGGILEGQCSQLISDFFKTCVRQKNS